MSPEVVVGIVGIIIATAVSIWIYRKTSPKRVVRYRVESASLLSQGRIASGRLMVSVDGNPVENPHLVTLTIWSSGRADISSQAFDGGVPMVFGLGANIVEEVPDETASDPRIELRLPSELVLNPTLLRRRFQSRIRVIVDGMPDVKMSHSLLDIPVFADAATETGQAIEKSRRRIKVTGLSVGVAAFAVAIALLVVSLIIYPTDRQAYLPWGVVAVMLGIVAILTILMALMVRLVRWIGKNVEARSGIRS